MRFSKKAKDKMLSEKNTGTKSIKKTLLFSIIGLVVSVSILSGAVNSYILWEDAMQNMNTRLSDMADAYNLAVQKSLNLFYARVESLSRNQAVTKTTGTPEERDVILTQLGKNNDFVGLSIIDAQGKSLMGIDLSERDYFKKAMAGETYISSPLTLAGTEDTVLMVATKVNHTDGSEGVLAASLASETFSEIVSNITIGESGYAYIVDNKGTIIAHKNQDRVLSQTNYLELAKTDESYASLGAMTQEIMAGGTGVYEVDIQGQKFSVAYEPIPDTEGWSICVLAKNSEMLNTLYSSIAITLAMILVFILAAALLAVRIANPIAKPIIAISKRMQALAAGDLHTEIPAVKAKDEIGVLAQSFGDTVENLNGYIGEISYILNGLEKGDCTLETQQNYYGDFVDIRDSLNGISGNLSGILSAIREAANQVATGAEQVASGAQALSAGTTEQAATVEELNASIASIAEQAEKNSESVRSATAYVEQADQEVVKSNEHMQQFNVAMREIADSSQEISKITKLVDDIAFQTNILALNAAVEAARAGNAGKGFAVVADEVRNLAAKSAEAARQTAGLIQKSSLSVSQGERLAEETQKLLANVAEKSRKVEGAIYTIEEASNQQAQAISQVNQGLEQVAGVVQTNAATAEESSASSEEMAAQAEALQNEVAKFKLRDREE